MQAFTFTKQITGEVEVAAKTIPTHLKSEYAGSGDKKD
jgi:hypothetical protein